MSTAYLKCKDICPEGSLTAIEHVLYRQGITNFEYDANHKHIKIIYDEHKVAINRLLKKVEEIGYSLEIINTNKKNE
jgi:copper chaperone CopZ